MDRKTTQSLLITAWLALAAAQGLLSVFDQTSCRARSQSHTARSACCTLTSNGTGRRTP